MVCFPEISGCAMLAAQIKDFLRGA